MGLKHYEYLNNLQTTQNEPIINKQKELLILVPPNDMIALANNVPITRNLLKVHNLANYRRKASNILLVPDVSAEIDKLMEVVKECVITL